MLGLRCCEGAGSRAPHCSGSSCCRAWAVGHVGLSRCSLMSSVVVVRGLQNAGSVAAPGQMESFWTRDGNHVPYIGRRILNQWTTREVQERCFLTREDFTPKRRWIMSGDIFDCHYWEVLLASGGWRLLLNFPQCTVKPHLNK